MSQQVLVMPSSHFFPIERTALPLLHEPTALSHRRLALDVALTAMTYGLAMGSFSLFYGDPRQALISAIKLPGMLLLTFSLSVPMFFVLTRIAGLRHAFIDLTRAIVQGQLAFTIILCSLAPLTVVWYLSVPFYGLAILFNGAAFAIASLGSHIVVRRLARSLIAQDPRHRWLIRAWLAVYVFVGIQMGWVLRPFIGEPHRPLQWFRDGAWGNAYVEIAHLVIRTFLGGK